MEFLGVHHGFVHEVIHKLMILIGFDKVRQELLLDLVVMRMLEPGSKVRSIALMEEYFGKRHRRQRYYESPPQWLGLKSRVESLAVCFARARYGFDYHLVFYDMTTLYFETFESDGLRKNDFSMDNKSQQPQILVALMVTKEGLPISYEVFPGNTFEGHTLPLEIPLPHICLSWDGHRFPGPPSVYNLLFQFYGGLIVPLRRTHLPKVVREQ